MLQILFNIVNYKTHGYSNMQDVLPVSKSTVSKHEIQALV